MAVNTHTPVHSPEISRLLPLPAAPTSHPEALWCHSHTVGLSRFQCDKAISQEQGNITPTHWQRSLSLPPGHLYIKPLSQDASVCNFIDRKGQNFTCIYCNSVHTLLKPFRDHLLAPGPPTALGSKGMLAREFLYIPCQGQQFKVSHRRGRC